MAVQATIRWIEIVIRADGIIRSDKDDRENKDLERLPGAGANGNRSSRRDKKKGGFHSNEGSRPLN